MSLRTKYALSILSLLLLGYPLHAAELWRFEAPPEARERLLPWLPPLAGEAAADADGAALEKLGLVRRLRERIPELLATEGYFSPQLEIDAAADPVLVKLQPGPRAKVVSVDVSFAGQLGDALEAKQADALRKAWTLPVGAAFRQSDWDTAKTVLQLAVAKRDFPGARIVESLADVDPQTAEVRLSVVVDSGPIFYFGPLEITGLSQYKPELLDRYRHFNPGDKYSQETLLQFQSALQGTPYFSAVEVSIDTDPARAAAAPVRVVVVEAKPQRMGVGAGYSSNTGFRGEFSYSEANLFDRAWQLTSGVRLETLSQAAFADIFLPPTKEDHRYGIGAIVERSDIENLAINRQAVGLTRIHEHGRIETRVGLSFQHEGRQADGSTRNVNQALALTGGWTYRRVDNPLDPRSGYILNLQLGGASEALLSDANFLRSYERLVTYFSLTPRNVLSARIEAGYTAAKTRSTVPEDFLFRTGGAQTVRGYRYLSLGEQEANAIVGGRYMLVGSVEHTHWLDDKWGVATFVDAGNASDRLDTLRPAVGLGLGARWRSPAGPLAADLAWGVEQHRLRLHISIAIAF
ncbi:autotransporter assembly complex family protein [Uliginosibacterium sp. H3]|uniref:Autotransporter assembly complex family protein n=1 Tax=Uliginosibacterium silvisoli TaxID=3114758 RepID=A0ABU6K6Y7_9RHOO|nr:autotransporter assembly complex family protein [Uliginosibacterium sp. H3]